MILHLRYTAREGGGPLRKAAVDNLKKTVEQARAAVVALLPHEEQLRAASY